MTIQLTAQNVFLDENTGGKGKYFKARFLQPGLVKYKDVTVIISKELKNKKAIAIITGYKKNKKP